MRAGAVAVFAFQAKQHLQLAHWAIADTPKLALINLLKEVVRYAMAGAPGEEEDTPRDDDEGVEIKRTVSTADDHVEGYASGGASNDVVRVVRYCRIPPPFSQNEQHPILLTHVTTLPLSPGAC